MTAKRLGGRIVILGAALLFGAPFAIQPADAARTKSHHGSGARSARVIQAGMSYSYASNAGWGRSVTRYGRVGGGLQCVPFARENTGIELSGNAATWWGNAQGVYERGARPEVGSVLNFRANGRMRMGHVAVVTNVVGSRNIEIDHANWAGPGAGRGGISRNITVVDVSERNDWSAVRVGLGSSGDYGSIYPTYGFIYDRPDHGTMVANAGLPSAGTAPVLNAAPRDLRPASDRYAASTAATEIEEVAEAGDDAQPRSRRHSARHARTSTAKASVIRVHAHAVRATTHFTSSHVATSHVATSRVAPSHTARRHRF